MRRLILIILMLFSAAPAAAQPGRGAILIYSGTTGYRHDSIPAGIQAVTEIAKRRGLSVVASEDPTIFSAQGLKRFRAIVLLSCTTDPKNPTSEWLVGDRRTALQQFVRRGGGIVAIHAAADSHYHWPWYGHLIGGHFARHPAGTPTGTIGCWGASDAAALRGFGFRVPMLKQRIEQRLLGRDDLLNPEPDRARGGAKAVPIPEYGSGRPLPDQRRNLLGMIFVAAKMFAQRIAGIHGDQRSEAAEELRDNPAPRKVRLGNAQPGQADALMIRRRGRGDIIHRDKARLDLPMRGLKGGQKRRRIRDAEPGTRRLLWNRFHSRHGFTFCWHRPDKGSQLRHPYLLIRNGKSR